MLVLASVTIITLDYHGEASRAIARVRNGFADAVSPLQRGVQAVLHPLGDVVSAPFHYGQLQTENDQLRAEIGALSRQLNSEAYAHNLEQQVQVLRNVPFAGNLPVLPAEVIAPATSNFEPTVTISLGSSGGVSSGMPVISDKGLIGSVTGTSGSTATVELITDPRQPPIQVADSAGDQFLLTGSGAGRPLALSSFGAVKQMPKAGMLLVTEGQVNNAPASAYPAGLVVGTVTAAKSSAGGIVSGSVHPLADLGDLQIVGVVQWPPPA